MVSNFYKDLRKAKIGEKIAMAILKDVYGNHYTFEDVSEDKQCWHLGDIRATRHIDNAVKYIDVKMDSRIAQTRNILCEEAVYYVHNDETKPGCITYPYDAIAIVSVQAKRIWIIDYHMLQEHYKEGKKYTRQFEEQTTSGYLFPLTKAQSYGMIKAVIDYEEIGSTKQKVYLPKTINKGSQVLSVAV